MTALILVIALALVLNVINGFHDAANSMDYYHSYYIYSGRDIYGLISLTL